MSVIKYIVQYGYEHNQEEVFDNELDARKFAQDVLDEINREAETRSYGRIRKSWDDLYQEAKRACEEETPEIWLVEYDEEEDMFDWDNSEEIDFYPWQPRAIEDVKEAYARDLIWHLYGHVVGYDYPDDPDDLKNELIKRAKEKHPEDCKGLTDDEILDNIENILTVLD